MALAAQLKPSQEDARLGKRSTAMRLLAMVTAISGRGTVFADKPALPRPGRLDNSTLHLVDAQRVTLRRSDDRNTDGTRGCRTLGMWYVTMA